METARASLYQFGAFSLNPAERALFHGSDRIDLPARAFDTLVHLVDGEGKLVGKDHLMRAVWPDTIVEENNLSQAVYLLRKVLRDGENGIRYIETVPRQGYRFIAPVRRLETRLGTKSDDSSSRLVQTEVSPPPAPPLSASLNGNSSQNYGKVIEFASTSSPVVHAARSFSQLPVLTALALLFLVLAALVFPLWRASRQRVLDLETVRSIAVLPLQNFSNDPAQEYFADGMTDELITDLAQVQALRVVSRTSVMQYKGAHRPLPQIGRDLGVDAVIEGSVVRSGDRVRITAQLIRTATDTHLWAKSYEGEMKDVLSLQASVAEAITDEVKLNLTAAERDRLHRVHSVNPEAYEAYLRGRFFWNRRDTPGFQQAIRYFNQAIAKDPDFALPYSGLADCYILMILDSPDPSKMEMARTSALRAIALDDQLAEAHTSLAAVKVFVDWDWVGAEKEFKRAIELNPNFAPAHHWYGNILLGPLGRHEEAIAELKRAQSLDPLSSIINTDVGYAYFLARRYPDALEQFQRVLVVDPNFVPLHSDLSQYYIVTGNLDQCIHEELQNMNPDRANRIRTLYAQGGYDKVDLESARTGGTYSVPGSFPSFFVSAKAYAYLGDHQHSLVALQKSVEMREPGLIYLKADPAWDSLRSDPSFQAIERRIGLL
jgi:TolB-like protein/DNA-binding winged helix-turn-helix (wHTH) protein/tetratricopeptide (TPR) repeat protein